MDGAKTNLRERMAVVEGSKPADREAPAAPAPAESLDPSANIIKRLWRAELDIGAVEKSQIAVIKGDSGQTQYTYKFTGYDKVIAAVRPALARHGVKVMPTTTSHERVGNLSVVSVTVEFINVDTPADRTSVQMTNYGADKGDKGASKALTNAVREAIKKALGITSEEDDRADETTEFESADGASRKDVEAANEGKRAALEQWAKTFKDALTNAVSVKDIQRLHRESADQLGAKDLPEVTRSFFLELIETRKAAIAKADAEA